MNRIKLFDVVALAEDLPEHKLRRGEIGAVVEIHPTGGYDIEFVAQDGYTYALITAKQEQLIALRQKPLNDPCQFLEGLNQDFKALKEDSQAWQEELAER